MSRVSECSGKVAHPSRRVAIENLHRVRKNHDRAGRDRKERGLMVAYHCRHCDRWHIGNNEPFIVTARNHGAS